MDNLHDESECDGLHVEVDYKIRAYAISRGSLAFEKWFKDVFTVKNANAAEGFDFGRNVFEGTEYIEVCQHNPAFSLDALQEMFFSYRHDQSNKPRLSVVSNIN